MSIRETHHAPLTITALFGAISLASLIVAFGVLGWVTVIAAVVR